MQIKARGKVIYIDPAYLRTHFLNYPGHVEYARWPNPIDGMPEHLEKADIILVTHAHKDHCKRVTVKRLRRPSAGTTIIAPKRCARELGNIISPIAAGEVFQHGSIAIKAIPAHNTPAGS